MLGLKEGAQDVHPLRNQPIVNKSAAYDPAQAIDPNKALLNLDSLPGRGRMAITHLDMDLTLACNLRCTYCFKEKWNEHMSAKTARDAIVWLIYASEGAPQLSVALIGGEPLANFETMKEVVPFAHRRCAQHGKKISFSMTTNGTIFSEEIEAFCRRWNVGFHTSIDGHPAVQDAHRVHADGRGSSALLEESIPRILRYRPNTTARSTIMPDTVNELLRSYRYFRGLGYVKIAFVPADPCYWTEESVRRFESAFGEVADAYIDDMRRGYFIDLKYVTEWHHAKRDNVEIKTRSCGAGRGMVLIDIKGSIFPCHRWNKQDEGSWRLGNIYSSDFNDDVRERFFRSRKEAREQMGCQDCEASPVCGFGCPAENLETTKDMWIRHQMGCELQRAMARVAAKAHETLAAERNTQFEKHYVSEGIVGRQRDSKRKETVRHPTARLANSVCVVYASCLK